MVETFKKQLHSNLAIALSELEKIIFFYILKIRTEVTSSEASNYSWLLEAAKRSLQKSNIPTGT